MSELLRQNGDVPLLAMQALSQNATSLLWAPELVVSYSGAQKELDICAIIDGRTIVGEAKSNRTIRVGKSRAETARDLVEAAQILGADEIVLATSQDSWTNGTADTVRSAIDDVWEYGVAPRVRELVRVGSNPA